MPRSARVVASPDELQTHPVRGRAFGVVIAGCTLAACTSISGSRVAIPRRAIRPARAPSGALEACDRAKLVWRARVIVAAYETTAAELDAWKSQSFGGSSGTMVSTLGSGVSPVTVCYLAGAFRLALPNLPGMPRSFREIIVQVENHSGHTALDAASPRPSWPFSPPPQLRASSSPHQCSADQLRVVFFGSGAAAGTGLVGVGIANTSQRACSLEGVPKVRFLARSDNRPLIVRLTSRGNMRPFRGRPSRIVLEHQHAVHSNLLRYPPVSAGFLITSRDFPNGKSDRTCATVRAISVELPGLAHRYHVSMTSKEGEPFHYSLCNTPPAVGISAVLNRAPVRGRGLRDYLKSVATPNERSPRDSGLRDLLSAPHACEAPL